jgi:DNA-directed RNA polymerase specialized sigma24 family protein
MLENLTKFDFEQFLQTLDYDKDTAAEKYLRLRSSLESFFEWRDCENTEELTDIVFDRVVKKIVSGEKVENIEAFSVSIAKFVVLEHKRKSQRNAELDEVSDTENFAENFETEDLKRRNLECLRKCLAKLPDKKRRLLVDYYDTEENTMISKRKSLAKKMELNLNSLRIRVSRLREKLERCTKDCCDDVRSSAFKR